MRALLVGATGVVGREILRRLLLEPRIERVGVIVRRPLAAGHATDAGAKLDVHVTDFDRLGEHPEWLRADHIFCALGTTIRQAGSQQRFRQVDFDYPLTIARLGLAQGAKHFLLVSALGASSTSRVFYSRVKGELEEAILALPYRSVTIARPSMLMGDRAEPRLGEEVAKRFAFLVPRKYKPVSGDAVAAALVRASLEDAAGRRIIENEEMR